MELFILLLVLNYILDYPLQGEFLAKEKANSNYLLYVHSFIWGGGIYIFSSIYINNNIDLWVCLFLILGHYCIDYVKCRGLYKKIRLPSKYELYVDQFLHILQLVVLYGYIKP